MIKDVEFLLISNYIILISIFFYNPRRSQNKELFHRMPQMQQNTNKFIVNVLIIVIK